MKSQEQEALGNKEIECLKKEQEFEIMEKAKVLDDKESIEKSIAFAC